MPFWNSKCFFRNWHLIFEYFIPLFFFILSSNKTIKYILLSNFTHKIKIREQKPKQNKRVNNRPETTMLRVKRYIWWNDSEIWLCAAKNLLSYSCCLFPYFFICQVMLSITAHILYVCAFVDKFKEFPGPKRISIILHWFLCLHSSFLFAIYSLDSIYVRIFLRFFFLFNRNSKSETFTPDTCFTVWKL